MDQVYDQLANRALQIQEQQTRKGLPRTLVALAGPPGSGKSTISTEVARRLGNATVVVSVDGFHHPRAVLDSWPNRDEAYARRGAAWTYNAAGVVELVKKLREAREIFVPGFDHAKKDPEPDAICVRPDATVVIVEGNWLLFDEEPWRCIAEVVDDTWFVDVDPELARVRVARRHLGSGIESTWEAAVARAESNDVPNGVDVRTKLVKPRVTVQSVDASQTSGAR